MEPAPEPQRPGRKQETAGSSEARLLECVGVIRDMLAGEEVTRDGLVKVDRAKLWTGPETPPALIGAAVSPKTADTPGISVARKGSANRARSRRTGKAAGGGPPSGRRRSHPGRSVAP